LARPHTAHTTSPHHTHISQEALAKILGVKQSSISKMERRADMYISSLRSHIKAMGGELDIIARFPDGDLKISGFSDI
jgi:transcriptional regulator with XRE-family HTH domain